jgi:hypothetical protein
MIEVLKQTVKALELVSTEFVCNGAHHAKKDRHQLGEPCPIVERYEKAIQAGKQAIAELESQEPDAWMYQEYRDDDQFGWRDEIYFIQPPNDPIYFRNIVPVYAHLPQRTWVGLTDEEVKHEWEIWRANLPRYAGFAKGIEAKLKEKNT